MRVLLAAAEMSPLARTGGLGEAVAGLAAALAGKGVEAGVAMPRYRHLQELGEPVGPAGPAQVVYRHQQGDVEVFLVDDPPAFDRQGIYGPVPGTGYADEWWRWGRFSRAVVAMSGSWDLLHVHDGHAGPACMLSPVPSVITIHNAGYAVMGPLVESAILLGVSLEHVIPQGALEWWGSAHYLKAGIVGADRVTTVSPGFAAQLYWDSAVSGALDGVISSLPHPVTGILNGIDTAVWDPATDPSLPTTYGPGRVWRRKGNRETLLDLAGLDDGFLLGNVGRMSAQKGIDLLDPVIDRLCDEGIRLVLVGNGELDPLVDGWSGRHPTAIRHLPYDEQLARLVYGGADAYLMPSLFEPCGIGQMYAMRYGCPPIVHLTGGLNDTVVDLDEDPDGGMGFGFRLPIVEEMAKSIRRAVRVSRRDRSAWRSMQRRGMEHDWSWDAAADRYLEVYRQAMG